MKGYTDSRRNCIMSFNWDITQCSPLIPPRRQLCITTAVRMSGPIIKPLLQAPESVITLYICRLWSNRPYCLQFYDGILVSSQVIHVASPLQTNAALMLSQQSRFDTLCVTRDIFPLILFCFILFIRASCKKVSASRASSTASTARALFSCKLISEG